MPLGKVSKGRRIQQALAILVMLVIWLMIVTKGFSDIAVLLQSEPDDFWRALAKYFFRNLAGGAGE
jgi:hypothetical protein